MNQLQHDQEPGMAGVRNDGEVTLLKPPLRYRVRPGALRIMAPKVPDSTGEIAA